MESRPIGTTMPPMTTSSRSEGKSSSHAWTLLGTFLLIAATGCGRSGVVQTTPTVGEFATTVSPTSTIVETSTIPVNITSLAEGGPASELVGVRFTPSPAGPMTDLGGVKLPEGSHGIYLGLLGDSSYVVVVRTGDRSGLIGVASQPEGDGSGAQSYQVEFATEISFSGPADLETFAADCRIEGDKTNGVLFATVNPSDDILIQAWRVTADKPFVSRLPVDSLICVTGNVEG